MIYIPKYDRKQISFIERSIVDVLGIDKDTYMEVGGIPKGNERIARYMWVYFVYNNTSLGVEDIADMIGRHHSNVSRAIASVRVWKRKRGKYYAERKIVKQVKEKIDEQTRILATNN
jgi:hypothetical protein